MRPSRPAVPAVPVTETPRQKVARLQESIITEVNALLAGFEDPMERLDAAFAIEGMCQSVALRVECATKKARIDLGLVVAPGTSPSLMAQVLAESPDSLAKLPDLMTLQQAAAVLRIGKNAAYELAKDGKIPVLRVGSKMYRVPKAPFLKYLERVSSVSDE